MRILLITLFLSSCTLLERSELLDGALDGAAIGIAEKVIQKRETKQRVRALLSGKNPSSQTVTRIARCSCQQKKEGLLFFRKTVWYQVCEGKQKMRKLHPDEVGDTCGH